MVRHVSQGKRQAFTLIELMIVVAIIAVLVAMLLPSLGRARKQAMQVRCMAQLKGVSLAILYYVNDSSNGNGHLPYLTHDGPGAYWGAQILPYVKIKRSKAGSRFGFLVCPADESAPYRYLSGAGDITGDMATEQIKTRADSGQASGNRRQGGGDASLGPLIEPISYAGSANNIWQRHTRLPNGRWSTRKLDELDRPYCQTLISEVYNRSCHFSWEQWARGGIRVGSARRGCAQTERDFWRHHDGQNPNSNGTNWAFADGHAEWQSVSSLERLFCCQDLSKWPGLPEIQ
ncbi:MAG: prepilin-type N-terminal cleavage/methylation domain-containing protein, partial [Armatimonadetes bacterium]|nr:prepilin-type N-terminal cleavage/methylation domain-containing protein [Armatimonadota bacterium]